MKIAARELNLVGITVAVVLVALTYVFLEERFKEWALFREQREELLMRRDRAQRDLDSREKVESSLEEFRQGLPIFPAGKKAESELLLGLEKLSGEQGLVLTRRVPSPETQAGDLYETSITCDWEGDLPALVKFLHAQQSQGVVSDVRQLVVQPSSGRGRSGPPARFFLDGLRLSPGDRRNGEQAGSPCQPRAGGSPGTTLMESP